MHIIMYERSRIMCILASRIVGRFRWHPAQSSFRRKNTRQHLRAGAMKSFWRACACAVY